MTADEEPDLIARAQAGEKWAVERIITSVSKLVWAESRRWHSYADPKDLVQEGMLGVLTAIRKFDPSHGTRFNTYAQYWWQQRMRRFARLSSCGGRGGASNVMTSRYAQILDAVNKAEERGEPEVAKCVSKQIGIRVDVIEGFLSMRIKASSLDAPAGKDTARTWMDTLASYETPQDVLERADRDNLVREAMCKLSDKEFGVIQARFLAPRRLTLAEVGKRNNFCRERARQVEERALGKLRKSLDQREVG
jgi:RNA polymerase sigma factor (sigma-70 family)